MKAYRRQGRRWPVRPKRDTAGITPINIIPELEPEPLPAARYSIIHLNDGSCNVVCNGQVIATGMTNADAWEMIDRRDQDACKMEDTRLRIGDAFSKVK